jgi:DNA-3-methyladenine glycosylase II
MHIQIKIKQPPLFNFEECLWFLNRSYDDCMLYLTGSSVSKVVSIEGTDFILTVNEKAGFLIINATTAQPGPYATERIRDYVSAWFDLERDLSAFYKLLRNDPILGYMAGAYKGLRLIGIAELFESICWGIIGQQINLTFAYKLKRRLVELYGETIQEHGRIYHTFPRPETIAGLSVETLQGLQFSKQKAGYLINVAGLFTDGSLKKSSFANLAPEEKLKSLTAIKGIGVWTANYIAMKTLNEIGCVPQGDAGLLKALELHGLINDRKDLATIDKIFSYYRGWESYLVHYLWRSLAVKTE